MTTEITCSKKITEEIKTSVCSEPPGEAKKNSYKAPEFPEKPKISVCSMSGSASFRSSIKD
jgi:hypothetical protein